LTQKTGQNAVASALFFDTPGGGTPTNPPVISIAAPASGQTVSGSAPLSATVTAAAGLSSVQFQMDSSNNLTPVSQNGSTYSYQWDSTTVSNGSHTFKVSATDNASQQANANVTFTVGNSTGGGGGATATFVKKDTSTHGSWKTVYGQDGEMIANDSNAPPSYAQTSFSGAAQFTWALTSDPAAPQQATGSARAACAFYGSPNFSLDVNLTDGNTHQLALYFLDWDNEGRSETVQIVDAASQQVIDTQTVAKFQRGVYLVWNVKGHVTVRFTQIAGANAVVSGAFFGPAQ
jgi:hypothetical protein